MKIIESDFDYFCPRCDGGSIRILDERRSGGIIVECAKCGYGQVEGPDEDTAKARLLGEYLDGFRNKVN